VTGHAHAPSAHPAPIRRAARWAFVAVLVPMAVATVVGVVALWPHGTLPTIPASPGATTKSAVVTDTTVADKSNPEIHARLGGTVAAVAVPPEYVP
jgi:hypothetical protein